MSGTWWAYLVVLACSGLVCAGLTPAVTRITSRVATFDYQDESKVGVGSLGGGAIVIAFVTAVLVSSMLPPLTGRRGEFDTVLVLAVAVFFVGFVGDFRQMLPSWSFGAEVVGAIIIWSAGIGIGFIDFRVGNLFLTVFWVVTITNAFKLIDNMVGLATGIATITCLTLFALALTNRQTLLATLSVGLAGSTVGLFGWTLGNRRVLLGNSGSRFIGFLIAFLSIQLEGNTIALTPILSCSFVVFYLALVAVLRLLKKDEVAKRENDYINQKLHAIGLKESTILGWSLFFVGSIGILTFVVNKITLWAGLSLVCLLSIAFCVGGILLLKTLLSKDNNTDNNVCPERYDL